MGPPTSSPKVGLQCLRVGAGLISEDLDRVGRNSGKLVGKDAQLYFRPTSLPKHTLGKRQGYEGLGCACTRVLVDTCAQVFLQCALELGWHQTLLARCQEPP